MPNTQYPADFVAQFLDMRRRMDALERGPTASGGVVAAPTSVPIGGTIWSVVTVSSPAWLLCDGSPIDAVAYPTLHSLMTNTPDLVHYSPAGTGLVGAGTKAGSTTATLTAAQLAAHTHAGDAHTHSHNHGLGAHTHTSAAHTHGHSHGPAPGGNFIGAFSSGTGATITQGGSSYNQTSATDTNAASTTPGPTGSSSGTTGTDATGSNIGTTGPTGSGGAFSVQNPMLGGFWYIRAL